MHQLRQVEARVQKPAEKSPVLVDGKPFVVPLVNGVGGTCKSYDIKNGFDFSKSSVLEAVAEELRQHPPSLLVLCPSCTDEGGWFNLNSISMSMKEYMRRVKLSRVFVRFCCRLFMKHHRKSVGKDLVLMHIPISFVIQMAYCAE